MALKRYVGPEESVRLCVAGYEIGTVAQGEAIAVPDELAELVEWQDYWQDGMPEREDVRQTTDNTETE